jgi:hypothetical protein
MATIDAHQVEADQGTTAHRLPTDPVTVIAVRDGERPIGA